MKTIPRHLAGIWPAFLVTASIALASLALPARGHDFVDTATLVLLRAEGGFQVDMVCDLDALALGADPAIDSAELAAILFAMEPDERRRRVDRLAQYFERRVRVLADGEPIPFRVSFPDLGRLDPRTAADASAAGAAPAGGADGLSSYLGTTARLEGWLPPAASTIAVRASRSFPPLRVRLLREQDAPQLEVERGTPSPDLPLRAEPQPFGRATGWSEAEAVFLLAVLSIVGSGLLVPLFAVALAVLDSMAWTIEKTRPGPRARARAQAGAGPGSMLAILGLGLGAALGASGQLWLEAHWVALGAVLGLGIATTRATWLAAHARPNGRTPAEPSAGHGSAAAWNALASGLGLLFGMLSALRFAAAGAPARGALPWLFGLGALGSFFAVYALATLALRQLGSGPQAPGRARLAAGSISALALLALGAFVLAPGSWGRPPPDPRVAVVGGRAAAVDGQAATGENRPSEVVASIPSKAVENAQTPVFTVFLQPLGAGGPEDP